MVAEISDQDFDVEVLKSDLPVLVDFWAPWCQPCLQLAPTLEVMATKLKGKIKIVKMDVEENTDNPSKLGIRSIPTLMIFKNGKLSATKIGSLPDGALLEWIEKSISGS
ncbi:Thioredoxin [Rickettsiales bacterium Ac37b]|nr:Thioredoxin [Rickettsiales bacterium Ac37b]